MKKLLVSFVLGYIRICAKIALLIHKPKTVGIAGSVGKSSTRNAIYSVLKAAGPTRFVYGNSETGVPLGILGIGMEDYSPISWALTLLTCPFKIPTIVGFKYMVVEMGIDDPLPPKNMAYLLSIVKPDVAISLNVSATHTMQFEKVFKGDKKPSREALLARIAEEDTKIITESGCNVGIYNLDDRYVSEALRSYKGKVLTFGTNSKDIKYGEYKTSIKGTEFSFNVGNETIRIKLDKQILPMEYREVFAATLLTTKALEISLEKAASELSADFKLPRGRGSVFEGKNGSTIIDSSYNASSKSTIAFLELLQKLAKETGRPAIFLMGDMRELGSVAEVEHKEVAAEINKTVDSLFCVGPLTNEFVMPNVKVDKKWFTSSIEAGDYLEKNLPKNSLLLVKGSQNEIFLEEAVKKLLANKRDEKVLCRQGPYWQKIKKNYFSTL